MAGNVEDIYRLSPLQEGMLFHSVFDPGSDQAPYTSQFVDELSGPFDPAAFAKAWQGLTDRHAALRTCFVWQRVDEPVQVVLRRVESSFTALDWRGRAGEELEAELASFTHKDRIRGFDLDKPPLHRVTLIRVGPEAHVLVLTAHHLLLDGWSTAALYDELFESYGRLLRGEPLKTSPAPGFVRYIEWLDDCSMPAAERHWRAYLAGHRGRPQSADPRALAGLPGESAEGAAVGQIVVELDRARTAAVRAFCQERNLTVNTLVQAALALTLSGLGGDGDVVYGAVCSSRPSQIPDVESIVGPMINTLPIRVRVDPDAKVVGWLEEIQREQLVCRQYDYASLTAIQAWSQVPAGSRLFDCLLAFQNYAGSDGVPSAGLAEVRRRQSVGSLVYPLSVTAQVEQCLTVGFDYDRARYSDELMRAATDLFGLLISAMTDERNAAIGDLPVLADDVRPRPPADADRPAARRLVAYLVPEQGCVLDPERLRAHLTGLLPDYMVPTAFVTLSTLPLTSNGKLDRAALPALSRMPALAPHVAPGTELEKAIAGVWCEVLHLDRVGVHDNFFALGGDSIESLRIISRLTKLDICLTPRDLLQNETVAKLAAAAQAKATASRGAAIGAEQGVVSGPMPATPIQCWFLGQGLPAAHHYNQAVVLQADAMEPGPLRSALDALITHHDALRTRFTTAPAGGEGPWTVQILPPRPGSVLTCEDLSKVQPGHREDRWLALAEQAQASMDPATGSLVRAVLADLGTPGGRRLLIAIHHMAVDIVSWAILLEDLQTAYQQAAAGKPIELPAKTTSYQAWARQLTEHARDPQITASWLPGWEHPPAAPRLAILDAAGQPGTPARTGQRDLCLDPATSALLMNRAPAALGVSLEDLVLSALATALCAWSGNDRVVIDIERHGRQELVDGIDLTRTVGWFTSIHPVELTAPPGADPVRTAHATAARREAIRDKGIGFGMLYHLADAATRQRLRAWTARQVAFNFHGKHTTASPAGLRELHDAPAGATSHPANRPAHPLSVDAVFLDGEFSAQLTYRASAELDDAIDDLTTLYRDALTQLAATTSSARRISASLVRLNDCDRQESVFCLPYSGGDVTRYSQLAQRLRPVARVFGLQDKARDGCDVTLPEVAAAYLDQIKTVQPAGPYLLVGWSFGGVVAHEVARQAMAAGSGIGLLCVIDTKLPGPGRRPDAERVLALTARARNLLSDWTPQGPPAELGRLLTDLHVTGDHIELGPAHLEDTLGRSALEAAWLLEHHPTHISCQALLFEASASDWGNDYADAWRALASPLTHRLVPGDHLAPVTAPGVDQVAEAIAAFVAERRPPRSRSTSSLRS